MGKFQDISRTHAKGSQNSTSSTIQGSYYISFTGDNLETEKQYSPWHSPKSSFSIAWARYWCSEWTLVKGSADRVLPPGSKLDALYKQFRERARTHSMKSSSSAILNVKWPEWPSCPCFWHWKGSLYPSMVRYEKLS